jgi:hypothetical protein
VKQENLRNQAHRRWDGATGHICDLTIDDKSRAICQLAVKAGDRFPGKEVQIPTNQVDGAKQTNQQTKTKTEQLYENHESPTRGTS